jgi:site-specific DNA-methyltransferase (adenine-specific)
MDESFDHLTEPELVARINQLLPSIYCRELDDRRVQVGRLFLALKRQVGHGRFAVAVRQTNICGIREAQRLMALAIGVADRGWPAGSSRGLTLVQAAAVFKRGHRLSQDERLAQTLEARQATQPGISHGVVCQDAADYLARLPGDSVANIVVDLPYGIGRRYGDWTEPSGPGAYAEWVRPYWEAMTRVLAPGGVLVSWQHAGYLPYLPAWFPGAVVDILPHLYRGYQTYEPLVRYLKPGGRDNRIMKGVGAVLPHAGGRPGSRAAKRINSSAKSERQAAVVLEFYTRPGEVVLDPFCGTGTVPCVATRLGRVGVGCDRDPAQIAFAQARLADTLRSVS